MCCCCVLTFHFIRPLLSPSLLFYFSCTSPWLHNVPAVWNNVYFVALLNTWCVFSFLNSRSCFLPSAVACLFFLQFVFFYPLSLLRSPVTWFIVFTAVNFHLVFFLSLLHLTPSPGLLQLGATLWLWFWGVVVSSWILPTLLLAPSLPLWPSCPFTFVAPPLPHLLCVACVTCSHCSGAGVTHHTPHTAPTTPNHLNL